MKTSTNRKREHGASQPSCHLECALRPPVLTPALGSPAARGREAADAPANANASQQARRTHDSDARAITAAITVCVSPVTNFASRLCPRRSRAANVRRRSTVRFPEPVVVAKLACAEPGSRPKPAARRVEAQRRALTPVSTGRHCHATGELIDRVMRTGTDQAHHRAARTR